MSKLESIKEDVWGHPLIIKPLLAGLGITVCVQTGTIFVSTPEGTHIYRAPEEDQCDLIYDTHLPLRKVNTVAVLQRCLAALEAGEKK